MGNACLRSSEIHHQEEEDVRQLEEMIENSASRLTLLKKRKIQQQQRKRAITSYSLSSSSSSAPSATTTPTAAAAAGTSPSRSLVVPVEMKPAMEILPSSQEGVVRVKLIISTNQMASMINASYKKDDFLESLITSLLKEKGINIPEQSKLSSSSSRKSNFSSWKPALESIPEVRSS